MKHKKWAGPKPKNSKSLTKERKHPLLHNLELTYGETPVERDVFGRREASTWEIEKLLRGKER